MPSPKQRPAFVARGVAAAVLSAAFIAGGGACARAPVVPAEAAPAVGAGDVAALRDYIKGSWAALTRSNRDLLAAARDPKVPRPAGRPWPVYISPREDRARVEAALDRAMPAAERRAIEIRALPAGGAAEPGLLYLPGPYVVPGGRFNEMYGWDSYFIVLGLLDDGEIALARSIVDNFLYEIVHYGNVLNANRTYYLTRSQPPFLTEMLLAVFGRTHDRAWLEAALPAVRAHHRTWTTPPHLIPSIGLSRYFDVGAGPAPEVVAGERDAEGRTHYDRVRAFYRAHPALPDYDVARFYDRERDRLTDLFYEGDRSMRESGFDPSNRFGPFGADVTHYAPVCLNVLLHRMETDMAEMLALLGHTDEARLWTERARLRRTLIDRYLWDERAGIYLDYDFETGRRRDYLFATTFYPLWAGIASDAQAARVRQAMPRLERAGGLMTSTTVTGNQWDAPFGWAPLQLFAVRGLERYGYAADAARLAAAFVTLVAGELARQGTIVEKYDVIRRRSDVAKDIRFGYATNEIGFGWTNGVVLELLAVARSARVGWQGVGSAYAACP